MTAAGLRRLVRGLLKKAPARRERGGGRQCRIRPRAGAARHGACVARRGELLFPDLLRFLRLQRHGHRHRHALRLRVSGKLQLPVCLRQRERVLAALAHDAQPLVRRLPLYPARRQPPRKWRTVRNKLIVFSAPASGTARAGHISSGVSGTACSFPARGF